MNALRRSALCFAAAATLFTTPAGAGPALKPRLQQQSSQAPQDDRPNIEVAFVLDTTSSMSGLIEGAKQKIWSIASKMARGNPTPHIKVGLVAFRDNGDEYVTRRFDLTSDLDSMYLNLRRLNANGGGDTPEHVGRGLGEAVSKLSWSDSRSTMKMIFLVGDAPPHDDYQDGWNAKVWAGRAGEKGIIVNTIRCGTYAETEVAWREIARKGDGSYTSIDQSGGMVAVATPYDETISKLNASIAAKTVYAGDAPARHEAKARSEEVAALPASVASDRLGYIATTSAAAGAPMASAPPPVAGAKDLTTRPEDADKMDDSELPADLRAMDKGKRKEHLAKLSKERADLEKQVVETTRARDAWMTKNAPKKADSFDSTVMKNVKEKASRYGIAYE